MGTISKGILGGFNGTVGTVIGGTWKGIDYMRSRPAKRTFDPTPAQLEQQAKFATVIRFLDSMIGVIRIGFKNNAIRMTAFNSAMSYNIKNAIEGDYPAFAINYPMALISRGDLPNALAPAASATGGTINFTWTDNSGTGSALPTDQSMLVAYCPARNASVYTTSGGDRSGGAGSLNAASFVGETVQTWIAFISEDGKNVAGSLFTGEVTV